MEVKIVMGREGRWGGAGRFEGGRVCNFIFTHVGTYVQRGSKFCFVVVLVLVVVGESLIKILLYLPILFNFTMLFVIAQNIALLSYFTMHSAALLGSLA
jgi:hypothetical protein